MLGKVAEAGRWAGARWGRVLLLALRALLFVALTVAGVVALQGVVGAQSTEDWDSITESRFDSAATDEANRKITEAQERRDAAKEAQEDLDCSLCAEAEDLDEESEAASEDTKEGVAELVDARALAIEDAPGDTEQAIDDKQDALDTLQRYAEDWSPESANEGTADPAVVDDARAEVDEQAAALEGGSDEGGSAPEGTSGGTSGGTSTGEDTAAAPPPDEGSGDSSGGDSGGSGDSSDEGSGGGSDEGGDEGSGAGPLAGISSALGGFGLGTLLAVVLIAVGVVYYVGGLLKEGLKERAGRIGRPTQAQAPVAKKPSSKASSGARKRPPEEPREERKEPREDEAREPRNERQDERSGGSKEPSEQPHKGSGKEPPKGGNSSPGDSSALADRLGAGGRRRRSEAADEGEEGGD